VRPAASLQWQGAWPEPCCAGSDVELCTSMPPAAMLAEARRAGVGKAAKTSAAVAQGSRASRQPPHVRRAVAGGDGLAGPGSSEDVTTMEARLAAAGGEGLARVGSFASPTGGFVCCTSTTLLSPVIKYRRSPAPGGEAPKEPTRRSHFSKTAELPPAAARLSSATQRCRIASASSATEEPLSNKRVASRSASVHCLGAPSASSARSKDASADASGGWPGPYRVSGS